MIRPRPAQLIDRRLEQIEAEIKESIRDTYSWNMLEMIIEYALYRQAREAMKGKANSEFLRGLEDFPRSLEALMKEEKENDDGF